MYGQREIPSRADLLSKSCLIISIATHYSSALQCLCFYFLQSFSMPYTTVLVSMWLQDCMWILQHLICSSIMLIFDCGCPITFRPPPSYFSRHWVGSRQFKIRSLLYGLHIINCYIFNLWWWTCSGNIFVYEFFSIGYSTTLFSLETVQGRIVWR